VGGGGGTSRGATDDFDFEGENGTGGGGGGRGIPVSVVEYSAAGVEDTADERPCSFSEIYMYIAIKSSRNELQGIALVITFWLVRKTYMYMYIAPHSLVLSGFSTIMYMYL
jgi:hypothetical protein